MVFVIWYLRSLKNSLSACLLPINNVHEKRDTVPKKGNSEQPTVTFFLYCVNVKCTILSQSEAGNFFMYIVGIVTKKIVIAMQIILLP